MPLTECRDVIRTLIDEASQYLHQFDGEGLAEVQAGLAKHGPQPIKAVTPQPVPACGGLDEALAVVGDPLGKHLVQAIRAARSYLNWTTYDAYNRAEIGDRFPAAHAFATLIGSKSFVRAEDWELGLFLIAPKTFYRDHHHAAPELYAPLTGPHGWRFVPGAPLDWKPAHAPIWNEPWQPHATLVGDVPFLSLFCWTRDVNVPARTVPASDWDVIETQL